VKSLHVTPSKIGGKLTLPPSKSQTIRALTFALLARGTSYIENPLDSPDIDAMIEGVEGLGGRVRRSSNGFEVEGGFKLEKNSFNVGNSGLAFRFITALASLGNTPVTIDGDASIRERRPILPLLDAINQLGGSGNVLKSGAAQVCGPWTGNCATIDGRDSQPVSALIIAGVVRDHLKVKVVNSGEEPWIALTLEWLTRLGIQWKRDDYLTIYGKEIKGFHYRVPSDMSSMAFPLVSAMLSGQELEIEEIDRGQGDAVILDWLKGDINSEIDVNEAIDTIPIMAVLGCFGTKRLILRNGLIARSKECDRIAVMCRELRKMGAQIQELEDGMVIDPAQLHGAQLECACDHRVALALSVAATHAKGSSVIAGAHCIDKTYKGYVEAMNKLGGAMRWVL